MADPIVFAERSASLTDVSAEVYGCNIGTTTLDGIGRATVTAVDGVETWIEAAYVNNTNAAAVLTMDLDSGLPAYSTNDYSAQFAPSGAVLQGQNVGSNSTTLSAGTHTMTPSATTRMRLRRSAAGVVTIETTTNDGALWTLRHQFAGTSTGTLYLRCYTTQQRRLNQVRTATVASAPADGTATGATVTATASIVPGAASNGTATAPAATLAAIVVSLIAGAALAAGSAVAPGATIGPTVSLIAGGATPLFGGNFFGDSITAGQNATAPANRWVNRVAARLGMSNFINSGIGGTVMQNRADSGGSPRASNGRSRYVAALLGANMRSHTFIQYGTNDKRYTAAPATMNVENFLIDYQQVIDGLRAAGLGTGAITLGSPPYVTDYGLTQGSAGFTGATRKVEHSFTNAVKRLAFVNGLRYAPVYEYLRDNGGASLIDTDGVHPLDSGHVVIDNAYAASTYLATLDMEALGDVTTTTVTLTAGTASASAGGGAVASGALLSVAASLAPGAATVPAASSAAGVLWVITVTSAGGGAAGPIFAATPGYTARFSRGRFSARLFVS